MQIEALYHQIQTAFSAQANPENALAMRRYMRDQFDFLGIKTPVRRALIKDLATVEFAHTDLEQLARALWLLPQREYQYAAIDVLALHKKKLDVSQLSLLLTLAQEKSWWDSVDGLASVANRVLFANRTQQSQVHMDSALQHSNLWVRRIAMIHQLGWRLETDEARLFGYAKTLAHEEDFFIRKAIGWALRDYARWQPEAVREFIETHRGLLSNLSVREALKHL
ncbi:DNA alkylation repair protein [Undibacterium danionis]|uniref:DNA alkylation repair protein n=1 Tax=Undibacterium danionis TaxID=1812100 RepID=A0ABV6IG44_9BURK